MEYVLAIYLIGAVFVSLFLVASLIQRPVPGLNKWETIAMGVFTTIVWPVFVGHAVYNVYKNKNL